MRVQRIACRAIHLPTTAIRMGKPFPAEAIDARCIALKGTMMNRYVAILAVLLCATGRGSGAEEPRVVELWPGKAPEEPGTIGEEKTFPSKPNKERSETAAVTRLVTNVTKPTITIFRPAKEKD